MIISIFFYLQFFPIYILFIESEHNRLKKVEFFNRCKIREIFSPHSESARPAVGEWVFIMLEYDVTKLPFTSISRENWEMLLSLDKESLYDVIQQIGKYVISGETCDCGNPLTKVVCLQLKNVIDRKGEKSWNSAKNLKPKTPPKAQSLPIRQDDDVPMRDTKAMMERAKIREKMR